MKVNNVQLSEKQIESLIKDGVNSIALRHLKIENILNIESSFQKEDKSIVKVKPNSEFFYIYSGLGGAYVKVKSTSNDSSTFSKMLYFRKNEILTIESQENEVEIFILDSPNGHKYICGYFSNKKENLSNINDIDCLQPSHGNIMGNMSPNRGSIETYIASIAGGKNYIIKWKVYGGEIESVSSNNSVIKVKWNDNNNDLFGITLGSSCLGRGTIALDGKYFNLQ